MDFNKLAEVISRVVIDRKFLTGGTIRVFGIEAVKVNYGFLCMRIKPNVNSFLPVDLVIAQVQAVPNNIHVARFGQFETLLWQALDASAIGNVGAVQEEVDCLFGIVRLMVRPTTLDKIVVCLAKGSSVGFMDGEALDSEFRHRVTPVS